MADAFTKVVIDVNNYPVVRGEPYREPERPAARCRWKDIGGRPLTLLLLLIAVILAGCTSDRKTYQSNANQDDDSWTITELRADHGHDTMMSEDGEMYHNYFCAVVLKKSDESINLLYENDLPENIDLQVGDRFYIDGLADATYSDHWRGYWLHDVRLRPIESN